MIPVHLTLTTSRGQSQELNYEIARDETLTPLLLNITLYNSLIAQERSIGDSTITIDGSIKLKNQSPIILQRRFGGSQALQLAAGAVAVPVNALLRGQFDDLDFEGISLDLKIDDGSDTATLERLTVDKNQIRPGETVELQAFARTDRKSTRLNSSHTVISYAVFCLKKKKKKISNHITKKTVRS